MVLLKVGGKLPAARLRPFSEENGLPPSGASKIEDFQPRRLALAFRLILKLGESEVFGTAFFKKLLGLGATPHYNLYICAFLF